MSKNKSEYLEAARTGRGTSDRVTKTDKEVSWVVYEKYNKELRVALQEKLGLKNIMAVPKLTKVVINMGVAGSFSEDISPGEVVEVIDERFSEIGFEDVRGYGVCK